MNSLPKRSDGKGTHMLYMFQFEYDHTNYISLLRDFALKINTRIGKDNILYFPHVYAEGYYRVVTLPKGMQAMLMNVSLNQDCFINRRKSEKEFFIIRFDEIQIQQQLSVKMGKEYAHEGGDTYTCAVLTSSATDYGYILRKGSKVNAINIIITRKCLEDCIGIDPAGTILEKYFSLKTAGLNFEPIDTEYRRLIVEIMMEEKKNSPLKEVIIQNRIMLLLERFFTRLYKKILFLADKPFPSKEMRQLMKVEAILSNTHKQKPPTVEALSRIAHMSATKFKQRFKEVYGCSPYEYFQQNRMLKARNLLATGQYSVKAVGLQLNFKNLSNFSAAFKKEFGMLPSDMLRV